MLAQESSWQVVLGPMEESTSTQTNQATSSQHSVSATNYTQTSDALRGSTLLVVAGPSRFPSWGLSDCQEEARTPSLDPAEQTPLVLSTGECPTQQLKEFLYVELWRDVL